MALIIRDEQMASLRAEGENRFVHRLLHQLVHEYPDDYVRLGDAGALALIHATVRSGADRRIDSDAALAELLRLYVEFGLGLERAPQRVWATEVLDHPKLLGDLKVNLVRQRLSAMTQGRRIVIHNDEDA